MRDTLFEAEAVKKWLQLIWLAVESEQCLIRVLVV